MRGIPLSGLGLIVVFVCLASAACAQDGTFVNLGLGGGGGMYTPLGSPTDPNFMLMSCDMGDAYRSADGGKTFEMMHWSQMGSCHTVRPCFVKDEVYWARGVRELKVSRDKAKTWTAVVEGAAPWQNDGISQIAAVATDPVTLFVAAGKAFYRSADGGRTWQVVKPDGAEGELACGAVCVLGSKVFASIGTKFYAGDDAGKTWKAVAIEGADDQAPSALTAASDKTGSVVYAVVPKRGVFQSLDEGKTWKQADQWKNQVDVIMPLNQTQVAYTCDRKQVFRTLDGGKTWEPCLNPSGPNKNMSLSFVQTDLFWGYSIMQHGLGVVLCDPNTVLVSTQGDFYVSRNRGDSWDQYMDIPVGVLPGDPGFRFKSKGLEVTTTWWYRIDPKEPNRHFICYTDIGFARSVDKAETWISSTKGSPWVNTFYDVVFDPFVKRKMYAACSTRHDIPHWTHIDKGNDRHVGGVCVSEDGGVSWSVLGAGLPKLPCTSICIDPKSTEDKLTMYCTMYEGGVYKTTDGGQTWVNKSSGLGNPGNLHALMVRVHPKTGSLFCSITAMREGARDFRIPGGLWKSTDGGESWTDLTKDLKLHWANGFALDPRDENVIYLTAATIPGGREGGLYKTTDGGKTWERIRRDEDFAPAAFIHGMFVNLHPDNPDTVYFGLTAGLWVSKDAGKTWEPFSSIPFRICHNVTFDPTDTKTMYVTTFGGGVWKGYYMPVKK